MTSVVLRRAGLRIAEPAAMCQAPAEDLDRLAQVLRCEREDLCDRTHPAEPGGQDPLARRVARKVTPRNFGEGLVGALNDALAADVNPRPRGHLTVHHQPGAIELLEMLPRSEEHTSELQSLMRISYAVFCLKKKKKKQ